MKQNQIIALVLIAAALFAVYWFFIKPQYNITTGQVIGPQMPPGWNYTNGPTQGPPLPTGWNDPGYDDNNGMYA